MFTRLLLLFLHTLAAIPKFPQGPFTAGSGPDQTEVLTPPYPAKPASGATPTLAAVLAAGNVAGAKIVTLTDPTAAQDAATKAYVDTAAAAKTLAQVLAAGHITNDLPITGAANADGAGASANIVAANSGHGGDATLVGGDGAVAKDGGGAFIRSGAGDNGNGGGGSVLSFPGGSADGTGATGQLLGGNASFGGGKPGGDINLVPGAGDGAGRNGLIFPNLPTADPGVSGALYSLAGVVHVSP